MNWKSWVSLVLVTGTIGASAAATGEQAHPLPSSQLLGSLHGMASSVTLYGNGDYAIASAGSGTPVIRSDVEADVDFHVLRSSAYPKHLLVQTEFNDQFGSGSAMIVTHSGLAGAPDLTCTVRLYREHAWGDIEVNVVNTTQRVISVQAVRTVHAIGAPVIDLSGPAAADRILSDSFSEDRPQLAIRDLGDAVNGVHRAVGSQLIYNRRSGQSLFLGALTSERLLTIFHLQERGPHSNASVQAYEIVATGTTEIVKGESLKESSAGEQVTLSLQVNPSERLSSERLMFDIGRDYHAQLENYGRVVRLLHQARVTAPTPMGWWSWTAYYFGINQGTASTNAHWLAQNLAKLGYVYYQIDEGYQYARGEYTSADAALFPRGIGYIADLVSHDGLTFGLWTAPFEVSERAWVFQMHPEWLLHNAAGQLIHIGHVADKQDALYVLDTTHPGAQQYLRQTYSTFYNWGVRFIKMDFMDDTAVEGSYTRPNTTALEAQRIGLKIIREAVGDDVVLDKDGSPMLNTVGIVDTGRISQDTGHSFDASRDAASGIAARYYMNRNYFIADPDAFTVSTQTVDDQSWHGGQRPLTLDEAKVSIALAAVSGGMFEIGDDLPTLGASAERVALVKNLDLIDMARLGRASIPADLLSYSEKDRQPSIFLLKESARQSILTVFNWTDAERKQAIDLVALGLKEPGKYRIVDVFGEHDCCSASAQTIDLVQKPHSVRVLKLIDETVPATAPQIEIRSAARAKAGESVDFNAAASSTTAPVLVCHWDFGDGSHTDGMSVRHAFTRAGDYAVQVTSTGLEGAQTRNTFTVSVSGEVATRFDQQRKRRSE